MLNRDGDIFREKMQRNSMGIDYDNRMRAWLRDNYCSVENEHAGFARFPATFDYLTQLPTTISVWTLAERQDFFRKAR